MFVCCVRVRVCELGSVVRAGKGKDEGRQGRERRAAWDHGADGVPL